MDRWELLAIAAAAVALLAVVSAVLVVTLQRGRRLRRDLAATREQVEALRARVENLTAPHPAPGPGAPVVPRPEFVITGLGAHAAPESGRQVTAGQFTQLAVGESLVRVLSLGYGVGRALSAENRNRIRFEIRREVRRSRKRRRRDLRAARRLVGVATDSTTGASAAGRESA